MYGVLLKTICENSFYIQAQRGTNLKVEFFVDGSEDSSLLLTVLIAFLVESKRCLLQV